MILLQTQKNQVYELIEREDLSPGMFSFDESNSYNNDTFLRLKNSDYYFIFATSRSGGHFARFSPGEETPHEDHAPSSWINQLGYVRRWLFYLKRELNAPNKWKLLEEELNNLNFDDIKYDNVKFTYQEYQLISEKIAELKVKISKLDLLENQITVINSKLDHLLELAKNMNKTDWKELFIGSIISLTMQLSIDRSVGKTIFEYLKSLFIKLLPGS